MQFGLQPSSISNNPISDWTLDLGIAYFLRLRSLKGFLDMKLLIVDEDHPVLRDGLAGALLQLQAGPDTTVLQARDATEGIAFLERDIDLDIVILFWILLCPG